MYQAVYTWQRTNLGLGGWALSPDVEGNSAIILLITMLIFSIVSLTIPWHLHSYAVPWFSYRMHKKLGLGVECAMFIRC